MDAYPNGHKQWCGEGLGREWEWGGGDQWRGGRDINSKDKFLKRRISYEE